MGLVLAACATATALHGAVRAAGSADAILAWMPFRCPLRWVTGIACPTCGLGHAVLEAIAGNFAASWQQHPAALLLGSAAIVGLLARAVVPRARIALRLRRLTQRRSCVGLAVLLYVIWGFARQA